MNALDLWRKLDLGARLEDFFDASALSLMSLAGGWVAEDQQEQLLERLRELAEDDPGFAELLKMYEEMAGTSRERSLFLTMARAAIEVAEQEEISA